MQILFVLFSTFLQVLLIMLVLSWYWVEILLWFQNLFTRCRRQFPPLKLHLSGIWKIFGCRFAITRSLSTHFSLFDVCLILLAIFGIGAKCQQTTDTNQRTSSSSQWSRFCCLDLNYSAIVLLYTSRLMLTCRISSDMYIAGHQSEFNGDTYPREKA